MADSLGNMRDAVRDVLRRDSDALDSDRIDDYIYWAEQRIAMLHTFNEMRKTFQAVTVASQKFYTYPARIKELYSIRLIDGTNSRKLVYVPHRKFDGEIPSPAALTENRPTHYVPFGTYFELWRIPDDVYTLQSRIAQLPQKRTATSSESTLLNKDALIIAGAKAFGLADLEKWEGVTHFNAAFNLLMREATALDDKGTDWDAIPEGFQVTDTGAIDPHNPFAGRD